MDLCQRLTLYNPDSGHQSETGTFKTQSAAKIEMFIAFSPHFTGLFVVVNYETMGLPGRGSRLVTGVAEMMDYRLRVKCRQKVCPVNKNRLI